MSKIYNLKEYDGANEINPQEQIPSLEYVNEIVKAILDIIKNHMNNTENAHSPYLALHYPGLQSINTDTEKLPIGLESMPVLRAAEIQTDSMHKFVSESLLKILKEKPTAFEMETALEDLRKDLKSEMNAAYIKLLNTPDALNKLKDIAYLLQEEANLDTVISLLATKVTKEDFTTHIKSKSHLNNNDRKALNLLLGFIAEGCADWLAKEDAPNFIKNKPKSLPADGGNADTVGGYKPSDLLYKRIYNYIIGVSGNGYTEDQVDFFIDDKYKNIKKVFGTLKALNTGTIHLRNGIYVLDTLELEMTKTGYGEYILSGDGKNSVIKAGSYRFDGNVYLKDLNIVTGVVHIGSHCKLENITFNNCKIFMESSYGSVITGCEFQNCAFYWDGSCISNMITNNRTTRSMSLEYIGGNNLIANNLYY